MATLAVIYAVCNFFFPRMAKSHPCPCLHLSLLNQSHSSYQKLTNPTNKGNKYYPILGRVGWVMTVILGKNNWHAVLMYANVLHIFCKKTDLNMNV